MRFIADENYPLPSIKRLRAQGHDVAAVILDSPGTSDQDVLERAVQEKRIILTFDRDFGRLLFHFKLPSPPGIVYFRFHPSTPVEPADMLLRLLAAGQVLLEDKLTVIDPLHVRQRPLPKPQ
jgi:predicted nuclease of predicted toxin-antitoxin system